MKNIWADLPKPLFIQAPMEDVTDTVLRQMLAKYGRPDIFFTEFTNVDGLTSKGRKQVEQRLKYTEVERPLIAQIWGSDPDNFYTVAKDIFERGFDGIDINMGCPQKDVIKKGMCAALIENRPQAHEIIEATISGANGLPVSVKTRIGIKEIITEDWIGFLLEHDLSAITVHGRTVKEMSLVPAHWDEIKKAVELRDKMKKKTIIIGNGDVTTREIGEKRIKETGVDGVMIGRGIFNDLTVFNKVKFEKSKEELMSMLEEHRALFEQTWGESKDPHVLNKFLKTYINNFPGASKVREEYIKKQDRLN